MSRAHRLPNRLIRWTSLSISFVLVVSLLTIAPISFFNHPVAQAQGGLPNGTVSRVAAPAGVLGPPEANLPNLDELRLRPQIPPQAPLALPSTDRSRRNPLEPPNGKKVGDPGTTLIGALNIGRSGDLARSGRRAAVSTIRDGSISRRLSKFSHSLNSGFSNPKLAISPPPPIGDDQYVQTLFQNSLGRQPYTSNPNELGYWDDILRVAYAHGNGSIVIAARELGKTLFESSDYAARNRSNHDYVYDLYETYLLRGPDTAGWAYWESMVPSQGREAVRRAFDECPEFISDMGTVTPNGSASSNVSSLLSARADLNNQTGNQLLARDCEWAVSLLSLPGRSGLDLGLGLSYSSAVWTRSGPYMYFDEDNGWPSPGFRLGFPTVQEKYFDAQVGKDVYLLITPSGRRVELRQVPTTNVYEAADSSYLQLTDNGSTLLVRDTSGTQLSYSKYLHEEWHCTQIKDRNGNYISVNYDWMGHITSITDTLNRTINFNYDGNANLISITQTWNGQTPPHPWVTFGWGSSLIMQSSSFAGVAVAGTYNGESIPVIRQVSFDDSTYAKLLYNGQGQVTRITNYASDSDPNLDNHARNYTAYDYDNSTSDCPRINDARVWAENWNGINGVPSEVITQFAVNNDGSHQMTLPDQTVYKETYGSTWQKGLVTRSAVLIGGLEQKWTIPTYTQDNINVSYQTNPRISQTNVYDIAGNHIGSTVGYYTSTRPSGVNFSIPVDITEFAGEAQTPLRRTHNGYDLSSSYLALGFLGLLHEIDVYDGNNNLMSMTSYWYDWAEHLQDQPGGVNPPQHDSAYNTSYLTRGNVCNVARHDVNDPNHPAHEFKYGYNTAGSVTFTRDHLWHQNFISYTDAFSDSINRNTFAYPTTATDADGFSSSIQYNYDFGAKTRAQGPPPTNPATGQPYSQWAAQRIYYDTARRVERVTNEFTGAYKRFYYASTYVESWWSVNNVADEGYANQHFDGLGRVIAAANIHPPITDRYSGQVIVYDQMGRAVKQSNPTEIAANWVPAGDDGAAAVNVAANGGVASAYSYTPDGVYPGLHFYPSYAIDGVHYINPPGGDQYWRDVLQQGQSSWLEVDFFNGSKTINEIDVYTVGDYPAFFSEPSSTSTFTQYGATSFDVQYWDGATWTNVQGSITNNNKVWTKLNFAELTTSQDPR